MSRKRIAAIIVGLSAFPAMALADTANVTVYGTVNLAFENVKALGATDPANNYISRFRLTSNSSGFGLKGAETIDGDFKVVWQLESAVNPVAGSGTLTARNSMVGLASTWGTVSYGKWDTPFKLANVFMEPFYATGIGYMGAITDVQGFPGSAYTAVSSVDSSVIGDSTAKAADNTSFSRRQGNAIQYWTPKFYGVSARVMYSPNSQRTVAKNPQLFSGSVAYEEGPINAAFAYEHHRDINSGVILGSALPFGGTPAITKDTGLKAAVGYKLFELTSLNASWTQLKYVSKDAATDTNENSFKRSAFLFTLMHKFDLLTFRGGYGFAQDGSCTNADGAACDVAGMGAKMASVGASYSLGKSTDVYGIFSRIWNKNGSYNFAVSSVNPTLPAGADPQGFGLGIRHSF